jgi:hypothetical protein
MTTEPNDETNKSETKQQAGIRLANQRMPKLRSSLVGIGRLGDYGLDKKQIRQIEDALDRWVTEAKARLNNRKDKDEEGFKLT